MMEIPLLGDTFWNSRHMWLETEVNGELGWVVVEVVVPMALGWGVGNEYLGTWWLSKRAFLEKRV